MSLKMKLSPELMPGHDFGCSLKNKLWWRRRQDVKINRRLPFFNIKANKNFDN